MRPIAVALLCVALGGSLPLAAEPIREADGFEARSLGQAVALPAPEPEWLRAEGFERLACPFRNRIRFKPGEIECGLIRVPENREVEGSRTIALHFVRIAATGKGPNGEELQIRPDPVIYLTGGPGVAAEGYVARLRKHRLLEQRELYILEQRGIGYSGDFCPFFADIERGADVNADFELQQRGMQRRARRCIEGAVAAGVDPSGYHTFESARDLKALRRALGLENWNVWGISYGSALAQAYLQVDPEGVRAAIIDAIVPLDLADLMRLPHWHARNLRMLFDACAAQPACARAYSGLETRYMQVLAAIREQPIELEMPVSERFPQGKAWLHADFLVGMPFSLLYEESTHPAIPAIIAGLTRAAERRDPRPFQAVLGAEGLAGGPRVSMGMATSVRCLDGYFDAAARHAPAEFEAHPVLARAFSSLAVTLEAPALCRELGLGMRDAETFRLRGAAHPTLVVNGAWDPITPVPLAEYVVDAFPKGRLVVFPHAGHGPTRSVKCAGALMNAFFDDPAAELDLDCVERGGEPARYFTRVLETDALPRALRLWNEDRPRLYRQLAPLLVAALGSLAVLLLLPAVGLARRLDGLGQPWAGGSRLYLWLAALAACGHAAGLAIGAKLTADASAGLLLFGIAGPASAAAWLSPLSLLLALAALLQGWRYRAWLPPAGRLGLSLGGLAVSAQSLLAAWWGLWP